MSCFSDSSDSALHSLLLFSRILHLVSTRADDIQRDSGTECDRGALRHGIGRCEAEKKRRRMIALVTMEIHKTVHRGIHRSAHSSRPVPLCSIRSLVNQHLFDHFLYRASPAGCQCWPFRPILSIHSFNVRPTALYASLRLACSAVVDLRTIDLCAKLSFGEFMRHIQLLRAKESSGE